MRPTIFGIYFSYVYSNGSIIMKKTIFYKKEGRKYVPVYEYDQELLDAFPKGTHLVQVYPGGSSRRFNIQPNYAAMIAAGSQQKMPLVKN